MIDFSIDSAAEHWEVAGSQRWRSGARVRCLAGGGAARRARIEEGLMLETIIRIADRRGSGPELGERLSSLAIENPVVLGLARGGMPVAFAVARALRAPLDVLVVRKIGAPGNPELGVGAVAEGDVCVLNQELVRELLAGAGELEAAVARGRAEVSRLAGDWFERHLRAAGERAM